MVGAERFELSTFCTPSKRATRLRYAPRKVVKKCAYFSLFQLPLSTAKHEGCGFILGFFTASFKSLPQKPRILRGYHIRLAHGYMDGGMDSLAES